MFLELSASERCALGKILKNEKSEIVCFAKKKSLNADMN